MRSILIAAVGLALAGVAGAGEAPKAPEVDPVKVKAVAELNREIACEQKTIAETTEAIKRIEMKGDDATQARKNLQGSQMYLARKVAALDVLEGRKPIDPVAAAEAKVKAAEEALAAARKELEEVKAKVAKKEF